MGEEHPQQALHCGHSVAACPRVLRPIHRHPPLWRDRRPHSAPRPTHEPHHFSEDQPRVAPLYRLAVPDATFPDPCLSTLQHRPSHDGRSVSPSGPAARNGNPPLRLSDRLVPIARNKSFLSRPTFRRSRLAQRKRALHRICAPRRSAFGGSPSHASTTSWRVSAGSPLSASQPLTRPQCSPPPFECFGA